jgi:hypothetical protein
MTADGIVDLLATYSRLITATPQDRSAVLARARVQLRELFPGAAEIDVPMRARCWRADRADRVSTPQLIDRLSSLGPGLAHSRHARTPAP